MVTATLTSKGQITIPKAVRQSLNLQTGDRVAFVMQGDNEAVLKPVTRSVDEVFGMLHRKGMKSRSVEDMNAAIAKRAKGKA
jgi:antitoxin PrlF